MPVTKKKGAIFEIYADSPQPTRRTSASSSNSSLSGPKPASPTKRPARKALASIPPRASKPASSAAKKSLPLGGNTAHPALSAKPQNISTGPALKPSKPASSGASGASGAKPAKMKIFVDEPSEKKPHPKSESKPESKETARRRPLGTLSASTSRPTSTSQRPLGLRSSASGPSSGRAFDIFVDPVEPSRKRDRASSPVDKENAPPDSPASRTRSKSRTALAAIDQSPSKPAKLVSKTKPRFEVQPLADVSVAYEASGAEPEGFRDQAARR